MNSNIDKGQPGVSENHLKQLPVCACQPYSVFFTAAFLKLCGYERPARNLLGPRLLQPQNTAL